jgi:hypothetical protein
MSHPAWTKTAGNTEILDLHLLVIEVLQEDARWRFTLTGAKTFRSKDSYLTPFICKIAAVKKVKAYLRHENDKLTNLLMHSEGW